MKNSSKQLELFRDMVISRMELEQSLGSDIYKLKLDCPVEIESVHVIDALKQYKEGRIARDRLLEWTNVVWFSDAFDYNEEQQDSIASVMNELEELDEGKEELSQEDVDRYIRALSMNQEI